MFKYKKRLGISFILTLIVLLTFCKSSTDDGISINSRELFDEDNAIARVHIDKSKTEYIEIDYNGTNKYNVTFQLWKNGKLFADEIKVFDIELNELYGISFEVNERKGVLQIVTGLYFGSGENRFIYQAHAVDDFDIDLLSESVILKNGKLKQNQDQNQDIFLWGIHENEISTSYSEPLGDELEASKKTSWSILVYLCPSTNS
ncbi:hypothetical protein [Petrocella sp. FN5]|uniref:hypothetical protein n=1 Tax=Petrocella sp. FN5 TaxID=3032002 RepID=UPI0023DA8BB0|nr:hypothetical protein [Petrocella sp. FN5]MDF1618673.1 hypothetical protein [Petrocella sp. FN5]